MAAQLRDSRPSTADDPQRSAVSTQAGSVDGNRGSSENRREAADGLLHNPSHAAQQHSSLQLMQRAASVRDSRKSADVAASDVTGEYCIRLPVADKAELSSAIIDDTVAALPVPPRTVSHVQGPVLEVHQVDDHSVDIKIVHSFRARYSQPIDEVRQAAAFAWQQRGQAGGPVAGMTSDSSAISSSSHDPQQAGHTGHLQGMHSQKHQHHLEQLHAPQHHHHHHHHHHHQHQHHHRSDSGEHCVRCTEIMDAEECMLPPDIKRCSTCVVLEHEASTDTEHHDAELLQPSSNSSYEATIRPGSSRGRGSSYSMADPAAADEHGAGYAEPAAAADAQAGPAAVNPSPFAGASPFAWSPFQAAGAGLQPFGRSHLDSAAGRAGSGAAGTAVQQQAVPPGPSSSGLTAWSGQQQQREQERANVPPLPSGTATARRGGGRLSVEILRGPDGKAGSGEHVVSPTAISDASDDAHMQQWHLQHQQQEEQQQQHMCQDERRLGWRFQQHQMLQQALQQQPSSAVLYPNTGDVGAAQGSQGHDLQPVHVRLTHKRTAHGHEEVEVSHAADHAAHSTPPGSPQQQQQQQLPPVPQQQLQLVRQQQQWMHASQQQQHQQQRQRFPWDQNINRLDMNVLQPPAGFAPLSGQKLPQWVLAQGGQPQWQQQDFQAGQGPPAPSQQHQGAHSLEPTGQLVEHCGPHQGLVGRSPVGHPHRSLGFQPRCEWELDPRKVLVGRRLAVGGFAEVFLGKYEGTVVAVKRLLTDDGLTVERFISEVKLLARLRHPNLILFMGFCTIPELCIVSEYMSKGSLYGVLHSPEQRKQRAAARGRLLAPEADRDPQQEQEQGELGQEQGQEQQQQQQEQQQSIGEGQQLQVQPSLAEGQLPLSEEISFQQQSLDPKLQRVVAISVARGMAYLHTRNPPILHLDLKSPNILLDDRWRVKITDFGLSRARQKTFVSSTAQGGTPEWMAPEVLRCEDVAEPADVYSYGVVLWELITGRPPWENYNAMQVVAMVGFRDMCLPLPASAADLFLLDLCKRCLDRNPQQRPTFPQIVAELDQHYGPPSWARHAQPLLPPTLRLPLPLLQAADGKTAGQPVSTGQAAAGGGGGAAADDAVRSGVGLHLQEERDKSQLDKVDAAAAETAQAARPEHAAGENPVITPAGDEQDAQLNTVDMKLAVGAATAAAAAAVGESAPQPVVQQQQTAEAPAAAAAPRLFSPFGGADLPPWSVESVDSLAAAAAQANNNTVEAAAARAAASRARILRQASSSDTSSSSCAADRHAVAAGEAGNNSTAVSTQPGSDVSITRLQHIASKQQRAAAAGSAGGGVSPGVSLQHVAQDLVGHPEEQPPAGTSACRHHHQQQQQQQQPVLQLAAGRAQSVSAADTDASSPQPASTSEHAAACAGGLSERDSSPFEEVQFAADPEAYLTPVQLCIDPLDQQHVQQLGPVHQPAAASPSSAHVDVGQASLFGAGTGTPLDGSSRSSESRSSGSSLEAVPAHRVRFSPAEVPDAAAGAAVAAEAPGYASAQGAADPSCFHRDHNTRPGSAGSSCSPLQESLRHQLGVLPAAAAINRGSATAGPFAAAARMNAGSASSSHPAQHTAAVGNGPASAPSAPGAVWPGQLPTPWQTLVDTNSSFTHSLTAAGSLNLPSDGSFRRNFWPSMTGTELSSHSAGGGVPLYDCGNNHAAGSATCSTDGSRGSSRASSRKASPMRPGAAAKGHGVTAGVAAVPVVAQASPGAAGTGAGSSVQAVQAGVGVQPSHDSSSQQALCIDPQQGQQCEPDIVQQLLPGNTERVYQVWPVLASAATTPWDRGCSNTQAGVSPEHEATDMCDSRAGAADQQPRDQHRTEGQNEQQQVSANVPAQQQEQEQQQEAIDKCSDDMAAPVLQSMGSGQHSSAAGHSTSFQRKGRFLVATLTPQPPVEEPCGHTTSADLALQQASAGDLDSSLGLMSACSVLQPSGWCALQPGWPLLGSSVSEPPPNVALVSSQQQQQQQHELMLLGQEQGLGMQMSAPARLCTAESQPATPATTPTALAAQNVAAAASAGHMPALHTCDSGSSAEGQIGRASDPACRRLAGQGYWGSGVIREPSTTDSSGKCSLRASQEGPPTAQHQLLQDARSSSSSTQPQPQVQRLPSSGNRSSSALAAMVQHSSSTSGSGGLCYRSGRFHVTVEQLQAWQQRQQRLQQQHAHLPHKSNSTGALLAAAGMATAADPAGAAAAVDRSTVGSAVMQQQEQQAKLMHPSASCSSLQQARQQQKAPGASLPEVLQAKQQQRSKPSAGVSALTGSAPGLGAGEEAETDTRSYCDAKLDASRGSHSSGGSGGSGSGIVHGSQAGAQPVANASSSCLRLKSPVAAAAAAGGHLPYATAVGKPPVVPSKTPSPASTPCLSPRLQRAKSRDYCKGRFQVHESPVLSHQRHDQRGGAGPATSGPSHSICMGQLQQLQQQVQQQQQQQQQQQVLLPLSRQQSQQQLLQPRASSPPDLTAPCAATGPEHASQSHADGSRSSGVSDAGSCPAVSPAGGRCSFDAAHAAGEGSLASSSDGGKDGAAAAAAAAMVQQRGRFTVRQESRPSSRPSSAQGSKAGSPRGAAMHHPGADRMSKLGSKSAVDLPTAAAAAAAAQALSVSSTCQPAAGAPAASKQQQGQQQQLDDASGQQVVRQQESSGPVPAMNHAGGQHVESTVSSNRESMQSAAAVAAADGQALECSGVVHTPTVADLPVLPPIRTVSKKGRFVVTQLTPVSTACCTPKSAGAATTPTAAAAAAGAAQHSFGGAADQAAAGQTAAGGSLSVSPCGPLITCPVCAVAQVMPQLPQQLSGQLLELAAEPNRALHQPAQSQQQQQQRPAAEQASTSTPHAQQIGAAAACEVIAAAVSGAQSAAGLSMQSSTNSCGDNQAASHKSRPECQQGAAGSSGGHSERGLHSCSSCGAPLPPMSQQEYQSAAAAAAAGVLDAAAAANGVLDAAAAVAAAGMQPQTALHAGRVLAKQGSGDSALHDVWQEAGTAAGGQAPHGCEVLPGSSPSTPHGLLAMAAAKVLAARQQQQLMQQQRQQRESLDASTVPSSSSRTPALPSRRSFEPSWQAYSNSTVGGCDLFSDSSYHQSGLSSGRSSNSSIAALPCTRSADAGVGYMQPRGGSHLTNVPAGLAATVKHNVNASKVMKSCSSSIDGSKALVSPGTAGAAALLAAPHASHPVVQSAAAHHAATSGVSGAGHQPLCLAHSPIAAGRVSIPAGAAVVLSEPASASARALPRSHPAGWIDSLSPAASSSNGCSGGSGSGSWAPSGSSSRGCRSPVNTPAH